MGKRAKKKNLTHLKRLLLPFGFAVVFAMVGTYVVIRSYAASSAPDVDVLWSPPPHDNVPLGTILSPTIALRSDTRSNKMAIVASTYYSSKYLSFAGLSCEPNIRCVSVSWPNFDNDAADGTFMPFYSSSGSSPVSMANFAYDHKFSICVTKPYPVPATANPDIALYTPHFKVVGNNKRFVIATLLRYYVGGDCDVNGGQTNNWYKTNKEVEWWQCYNNDGSDGALYDGVSRNSCYDLGQTLPAGNDRVTVQGGKGPADPLGHKDKEGTGGGTSTKTGKGGSSSIGSSSSATKPSSKPGPTSATASQGSTTNASVVTPSPFYDGKQYTPGSNADNQQTVSSLANNVRKYRPLWLTLVIMALTAVSAWLVWFRRRQA